MGYYTNYALEIEPKGRKKLHTLIEKLEKYPESESGYRIFNFYRNRSVDSCKWYDHEQEMKALSREFPDFLFTLSGEGEESGDLWKKYFLGGKMQIATAKITFDPFNEKELKS